MLYAQISSYSFNFDGQRFRPMTFPRTVIMRIDYNKSMNASCQSLW